MSAKQLPADTVEDLLGIARALQLVRKNHGAERVELERIDEVAEWLIDALALSKTNPQTPGHRAAWAKAERATAVLIELLLAHDQTTQRLVGAWAERLRARAK